MTIEDSGIWTENDDDQPEYERQYTFEIGTIVAEQRKLLALHKPQDIWPDWREERPSRFKRHVYVEGFNTGKVTHQPVQQLTSLELSWQGNCSLNSLKENAHLLPSLSSSSEWSGVYRLFALSTSIDRCCGIDTTGTLYLGLAGTGKKSWSILGTRLREIVKSKHHAIAKRNQNKRLCERFPWASLNVEWAYTTTRTNLAGREIHDAALAESWLLESYRDTFGEYPPLNEVG